VAGAVASDVDVIRARISHGAAQLESLREPLVAGLFAALERRRSVDAAQ
jgi:hypothetical protein